MGRCNSSAMFRRIHRAPGGQWLTLSSPDQFTYCSFCPERPPPFTTSSGFARWTLAFGGSHLAVTVVLSVFMVGLALGGYAIGRYADHVRKPLRFYGLLELGIAGLALAFVGLMRVYPAIYVALAK